MKVHSNENKTVQCISLSLLMGKESRGSMINKLSVLFKNVLDILIKRIRILAFNLISGYVETFQLVSEEYLFSSRRGFHDLLLIVYASRKANTIIK